MVASSYIGSVTIIGIKLQRSRLSTTFVHHSTEQLNAHLGLILEITPFARHKVVACTSNISLVN